VCGSLLSGEHDSCVKQIVSVGIGCAVE